MRLFQKNGNLIRYNSKDCIYRPLRMYKVEFKARASAKMRELLIFQVCLRNSPKQSCRAFTLLYGYFKSLIHSLVKCSLSYPGSREVFSFAEASLLLALLEIHSIEVHALDINLIQ